MGRQVTLELAMKYRSAIWGRLMAENASDLSDETIDRIMSCCVGGTWLPVAAKMLREAGLLELTDNPPYARG